jgi:hypothetical protein
LCIPFEAVGKAESFPRQSIKDALPDVTEWWMAKIMSIGRCLYHNIIEVTTCVTSDNRENALAKRIRSRSVRNSDSPGGYGRSCSGRDLASRASMAGTLPKGSVV